MAVDQGWEKPQPIGTRRRYEEREVVHIPSPNNLGAKDSMSASNPPLCRSIGYRSMIRWRLHLRNQRGGPRGTRPTCDIYHASRGYHRQYRHLERWKMISKANCFVEDKIRRNKSDVLNPDWIWTSKMRFGSGLWWEWHHPEVWWSPPHFRRPAIAGKTPRPLGNPCRRPEPRIEGHTTDNQAKGLSGRSVQPVGHRPCAGQIKTQRSRREELNRHSFVTAT
jgi:hypothetical protein